MPDLPPLRIIFAGTPEFAAHHLQALAASRHEVIAVYTQPDRPAGRGKKLQASPVKQVAEAHNIPVLQPASLKSEEQQRLLHELNADVMVVVAYGLLLPQAVLDAPKQGCLNVHGSILPRWRGAAPIQRAIEAGDTETGITIMQMDAGLDTGAMLHKVFCAITGRDTAASLHDKLMALGPDALLTTLEALCQNALEPEAQDDALATYASKLSKQEGLIDWQTPSAELLTKIRAFNPFPVAFTLLDGERLRIFEAEPSAVAASSNAHTDSNTQRSAAGTVISHAENALHIATADGALKVTKLQLPGKKAMPARDILNGMAASLAVGTQLGSSDDGAA